MNKTYQELIKLDTFKARYEYLKLSSKVGYQTFGSDRFINQKFYRSRIWIKTRESVIMRDNGCDLGFAGRQINGPIIIHHMNPITLLNLVEFDPDVINKDFLISVSLRTHNAIHYSQKYLIADLVPERRRNDTKLW